MSRKVIYDNISETIGGTPLVRLSRVTTGCVADVLLKLEFFNPLSSVKDRIALAMIEDAEKSGVLKPGMEIIEPTSGNTGIGLAFVATAKGYPITIVMPETMSMERRILILALGARLVLTPAAKGMSGAIAVAEKQVKANSNAWSPRQFDNPANPRVHYETTAEEIWADTAGRIDLFVAGVGTGGTITGVGTRLRELKSSVEIIAVEPKESPVLSGGQPGKHRIQGIGAGFIPSILNKEVYSSIVQVDSESALDMARKVACQEGIPLGISSGAVVAAALELARKKENAGKLIVALAASSLERYLSTDLTASIRDEVSKIVVTEVE